MRENEWTLVLLLVAVLLTILTAAVRDRERETVAELERRNKILEQQVKELKK